MKNIIFLIIIAILYSCSPNAQTQNVKKQNVKTTHTNQKPMDISMFPKAKKDEIQHIVELSPLSEEKNFKVELFVCKKMKTDCNLHSLQGSWTKKNLEGWGYDYYIFETNGEILSTLMACPDTSLTIKEIKSENQLLGYNSKLPIIIYTPKNYKVKYKLWEADPNEHTAKQSTNTNQ